MLPPLLRKETASCEPFPEKSTVAPDPPEGGPPLMGCGSGWKMEKGQAALEKPSLGHEGRGGRNPRGLHCLVDQIRSRQLGPGGSRAEPTGASVIPSPLA